MSPLLPDFDKLNANAEKMVKAGDKAIELSKILTKVMTESNKVMTQLNESLKELTKEIKGK